MDPVFKKFDVALREAIAHERPQARIEVLIRIDGSTKALRNALEAAGLEVHSAVGRVASGAIPARQLEGLAALPFVRRVELSRTLFAETK